MRADSASTLKRRRLTTIDPMDSESAKVKLEAAKQKCGREIRVFETSPASPMPNDVSGGEEPDDFYEFTAEDYYRTLPNRKEGNIHDDDHYFRISSFIRRTNVSEVVFLSAEVGWGGVGCALCMTPIADKFLKTRKIREAEEAARRSKITKAVMRVQFPDNCTLEGTFHPSETIQSLIDLLKKVIAQPELPFYIYTTPPKKQVKDMSLDFYSAGFVPGAIVYFSYDQLPQGDDCPAVSGPFLQEDILSLKGLELIPEKEEEPVEAVPEPVIANSSSAVPERKPTGKKPVKPKWLKL
ncbi:hypothetical protein TEA_017329 [Camellia sinensis var. sinensis]|uniref:UBX domain-containing protein n=1 Tax=Camellia sinensis var. sinensis TaxID=542762 RepID=A0A4S4ECS0_CAMSN|nr:hypothetical protein TEA_017329 [Camellia sinensis var. sinensis]